MQQKEERAVSWRMGRGSVISAAAVLLCAFGLLWTQRGLLWTETDGETTFCIGFLLSYVLLTLTGAALCLVRVRLTAPVRQRIGWVLTALLPIGTFIGVDLINETRIAGFSILTGFGNYLCYLAVFALFFAVTRRAWCAVLFGGGACLIFGVANHFVVEFRGQPILPWDLSAVGTAAKVAGGYEFTLTRPMLLSAVGLLCAVLLCVRIATVKKGELAPRTHLMERVTAAATCVVLVVLLFPVNILSYLDISVYAWNQKTSTEINGTLAGFAANVQYLMVERPEGYSGETVAELKAQIEELPEAETIGEPAKEPTIIVVMNESLTDLKSVGDLSLTQDNLPYLHSLQESGLVIWGTAYSSVYGGNTCNSEYEFLTGNTTAFLPGGSKPYQQYVRSEQTALPSILEGYGYECTAIHPGNRTAWQRNTAYPNLGFDSFLSAKDFDTPRVLERKLTTDDSNYDQVIYTYEHRDKDTPQFIFNVTIQNHGGFTDKNYETTVQLAGQEGKYPQTEQYLSLTKQSDQALAKLISYFGRQSEPVVILMFGDHWPNLDRDFLEEFLQSDTDEASLSELMRKYEVPFLLWANYPLEIENDGYIDGISLNYLSGLLLRAACLQGSEYTKYLENLRQTLPVITAVGLMDSEGNFYRNGEETPYDDLLLGYSILQYNNCFDEDGKLSDFFTAQNE